MSIIRLEQSKKAFNCKTEITQEGKIILCEPVEIKNGKEIPIGKEPVKFRIVGNIPVLENDGGVDKKTLEELDRYLEKFIR